MPKSQYEKDRLGLWIAALIIALGSCAFGWWIGVFDIQFFWFMPP